MPQVRVVYDLSGKEPKALERFSVDADEMVRTDPDRYSFDLPSKEKAGKK